MALLSSCGSEERYQTFKLGDEGTVIRAYRDATGFATTTPTVRLELYSPQTDESQAILRGKESRKLDIRLDEQNNVLIIYFCGGRIDEINSLIDFDGKSTVVQPIISDFASDTSASSGCEGLSFYSVTGS